MDDGQIVTLYVSRELVTGFRSIDHAYQIEENESSVLR